MRAPLRAPDSSSSLRRAGFPACRSQAIFNGRLESLAHKSISHFPPLHVNAHVAETNLLDFPNASAIIKNEAFSLFCLALFDYWIVSS